MNIWVVSIRYEDPEELVVDSVWDNQFAAEREVEKLAMAGDEGVVSLPYTVNERGPARLARNMNNLQAQMEL